MRYAVSMTITPATCRAARGLLDWTQSDLAKAANVSLTALRGFEAGRSIPVPNNLAAIVRALEGEGIEFLDGAAPGVRLRVQPAKTENEADNPMPSQNRNGGHHAVAA